MNNKYLINKTYGKTSRLSKFIVYFTNYNKLSITRNRLFANSKIICKSSYKNRDAFRILSDIYCMIENFVKRFIVNVWQGLNPLNANNTKRSNNTQTVPRLHPLKNLKGNGLPKASFIKAVPDNCLSEFEHFVGLASNGLNKPLPDDQQKSTFWHLEIKDLMMSFWWSLHCYNF